MNWRIVFLYVPIAVGVLDILLYVLPARFRWKGTLLASALILAASLKFLGYLSLGADMFNPELPAGLIWFWNWVSAGASILLPLAAAADFLWLLARLCGLRAPVVRTVYRVALPLAAWTLSAVGVWNGVRLPAVREVELPYENLPSALDGYRIVQLSDLHVSSAARCWRTRAVVGQVNALKADLVVLTGDYVDGRVADRAADMRPLEDLAARDGVWAVTGNHEYYRDAAKWCAFYRKSGFRFLHNEGVRIRPGLYLAGVNDRTAVQPRNKTGDAHWDEQPSVRKALMHARTGDFRLLASHNPKEAYANIAGWGVNLQLSGHTHGGVAPILRAFVANHNAGFVRGLYPIDCGNLYVSPGTGQWTGFPIRFFNRSEITVFTLRRSR